MKRLALMLAAVLLIASSAAAQDSRILPNSFAFDYSAHLAVAGLDTFALNADLSGSGVVDRSAHAFAVTLGGTTMLGTMPAVPVDEELRLVDDTLYLRAGEGWQAREDALGYLTGWIAHYTEIDADAAALGDWNLSGIDPAVGMLFNVLSSADAASSLSTKRLDDESDTAHDQTTLDLSALMQTEAFVDAVAALANAQGSIMMIYERAELADIVRDNSAMFAGSTATLDTYVGLSDSLLHRIVLNIELPIEPAQGGYLNPPFTASLSLDVRLSSHNQPQTIVAPDNAQPVTDFSFPPPPPLEPPTDGRTQYILLYYVTEGETAGLTFEAQAGDTVTITVSALGWSFDTLLRLVDPKGVTLAENDDHEAPTFLLGDYQSQIADFELTESGIYTALVNDLDLAAGNFVVSITILR